MPTPRTRAGEGTWQPSSPHCIGPAGFRTSGQRAGQRGKCTGPLPAADDRNLVMTEAHPIRTITPEEFEALTEVPNQAFLHTWPREALERERLTTEYDRTLVALDDQRMVGTGAAYSYQLAVPGGSIPAAGVTMIAVLPSYRRRGILTGLMTRLFSDAQSRSEPVAILFATEAGIYGRFGYGLGTQHQELTIRR